MSHKVLLLEMAAPTIISYIPQSFNNADKSANISLSNSNFTAQATADFGTLVRSSMGLSSGKYYFEYRIDNLSGAAGGTLGIGLARLAQATSSWVGQTANSWGYWNNGNLWTNNISIGGSPSLSIGDIVGVAIDIDNGRLWFSKNGVWLGTGDPSRNLNPQYTGVTGTLYPAASPFDYNTVSLFSKVTLLSDPGLQLYAPPVGFTAGWQGLLAVLGNDYYLASEGYTTKPTDTPANRYYDGRIVADGDPIYERSVSCVVWGSNKPSKPLGDIEINNTDNLLTWPLRDAVVTLKLGLQDAAYSTFITVAKARIDKVEAKDERTIKIVLQDKSLTLDKPIQNATYTAITPNAALEGYPLPIALGTCQWVPYVEYDPPYLEYQLNDTYFGGVIEARDNGVLINQFTGWDYSADANNFGIRRLTNFTINGKQCATINGTCTVTSTIINEDFSSWTSDNPTGWTAYLTETATKKFTQSGSAAQCIGDGTAAIGIYKTVLLTTGNLYFFECVISARTSGYVELNHAATKAICRMDKVGTFRGCFTPHVNSYLVIMIPAAITDVTIDSFVLRQVSLIERLPAWLTYLCVTRGGLLAGDLDTAGTITALDTTTQYKLNYYTKDNPRIIDILQSTMNSYCGWWWFDRLDLMKVGRLALPSSTPDITVNDIQLVGDIVREFDAASDLSNIVSGQKNYSVHEDSDIAGSVKTPGSGDPLLAAKLQLPYLSKKKGSGNLASAYSKAVNNTAIETLLTTGANTQTEANRIVGLYGTERYFYRFQAELSDTQSYLIEPGMTINVTTNRFGLTNKNLLVVSAKSRFLNNIVEITAWG